MSYHVFREIYITSIASNSFHKVILLPLVFMVKLPFMRFPIITRASSFSITIRNNSPFIWSIVTAYIISTFWAIPNIYKILLWIFPFWRKFAGRFSLLTASGAVRHQPNNWLYRSGLDCLSATNLCYVIFIINLVPLICPANFNLKFLI